jgi:hypothetical protein
MPDRVFVLWLALEPARRQPEGTLGDVRALQRLLAWYEAQHSQDREEMGAPFERRGENLALQFRGQTAAGRLFGAAEPMRLPTTRWAGTLRFEDPRGQYGHGPDTYEVDIVTLSGGPEDCWAIEAKHRRGAITWPMVARFLGSAQVVAQAHQLVFARRWIVAHPGHRPDALALAREHGVLTSARRQMERLERLVAGSFDAALAGET